MKRKESQSVVDVALIKCRLTKFGFLANYSQMSFLFFNKNET